MWTSWARLSCVFCGRSLGVGDWMWWWANCRVVGISFWAGRGPAPSRTRCLVSVDGKLVCNLLPNVFVLVCTACVMSNELCNATRSLACTQPTDSYIVSCGDGVWRTLCYIITCMSNAMLNVHAPFNSPIQGSVSQVNGYPRILCFFTLRANQREMDCTF